MAVPFFKCFIFKSVLSTSRKNGKIFKNIVYKVAKYGSNNVSRQSVTFSGPWNKFLCYLVVPVSCFQLKMLLNCQRNVTKLCVP